MNYTIDLHTHTLVSDGFTTPVAAIDELSAAGIKKLVLTDHNSIHGNYEKIRAYAASRGVEMPLAGLEASVTYYRDERPFFGFHMLVYGTPERIRNEKLLRILSRVNEVPNAEAIRDLERLEAQGTGITFDDLFTLDRDTAPAEKMMKNADGYVSTRLAEIFGITPDEVKEKYGVGLGPEWGDDVNIRPDVREVIEIAHEAGLVCVMAHPFWVDLIDEITDEKEFYSMLSESIRDLRSFGLDGLEASHLTSKHEGQTEYLRSLAAELGMITTGGSDYHGEPGGWGSDLGTYGVCEEELEKLVSLCEKKQ